MASNVDTFCDLCQARFITKPAVVYCPQCEEAICDICRDHHQTSKLLKSHQTIPVEEYMKLPPFIRQIKQYCEEHGDIFEFICPIHDVLCCKHCIKSTHNECKGYELIEDLVKTSSSSTALDSLEKTLHDIETNMNIAIKDRQQNIQDIASQKLAISKQVMEKRAQINKYLDQLEKDLLQKLEALEMENKMKLDKIISEMEHVQSKANETKLNLNLMKKHATDIQILMGARQLQERVSSSVKYIETLQSSGGLNYTNIEFQMSESFRRLENDLSEIGEVTASMNQTNITFSWQSKKGAQIFRAGRKQYSVDEIHLQRVQTINISGYQIRAGDPSAAKHLHLLVLKYNDMGEYVSTLKVSTNTFDIVPVDDKTIIVTGGGYGHAIHFIDCDTFRTKQVIETKEWQYGATFQNNALICCTWNKSSSSIKRVEFLNGNITKFKMMVELDAQNTRVTSDNNYLYHSDFKSNSVTCYDFDGKQIWTYSETLLRSPQGITLDSHSNIYVAGSKSNNVVLISPDGKHSKQILDSRDGLKNPHAIYIDKTSDHLLVANYAGPAFLYKITWNQ